MNLYKEAVREKVRFNYRGLVGVEDLWDLNVEKLDKIYKKLKAELDETNEESLLDDQTAENRELELKVDIIKDIVETKLEEAKAAEEKAAKKARKEKIMKILSEKKEKNLKEKSEEELREMLDELN